MIDFLVYLGGFWVLVWFFVYAFVWISERFR